MGRGANTRAMLSWKLLEVYQRSHDFLGLFLSVMRRMDWMVQECQIQLPLIVLALV
jgi:hypothetical protein